MINYLYEVYYVIIDCDFIFNHVSVVSKHNNYNYYQFIISFTKLTSKI